MGLSWLMSETDSRRRRSVRTGISLGVATLALLCTAASRGMAQGGAVRMPGAVMLKRIAEAVDGHRSGRSVYVVASYQPTFPVLGVFFDSLSADKAVRSAGPQAGRFGPYQTSGTPGDALVSACVHIQWSSAMQPDRCTPPVRQRDVVGMTLTLTLANGKRETLPLPSDADAIFLGLAAIDKFAVPYYVRTLGLADATELRRGFERAFSRRSDGKP